jgi:hypothetical protein
MFQTNQGPSFPAHQFIFGGTSAPSAADDAAGIFASENMSNTGVTGTSAATGCTAPADTTVQLIGPTGETQKVYPCFEHSTVPDILTSALTWRYYAPSAGSIWTSFGTLGRLSQALGRAAGPLHSPQPLQVLQCSTPADQASQPKKPRKPGRELGNDAGDAQHQQNRHHHLVQRPAGDSTGLEIVQHSAVAGVRL